MKKILVIEKCRHCWRCYRKRGVAPMCISCEDKQIDDIETIPCWCPLPDASVLSKADVWYDKKMERINQ